MTLAAHDLSIGYRSAKQTRWVGRHMAAELKAARLTALLGTNGAGKSTLIRTLSGLLTPLEGLVTLNDTPLTDWKPTELARQIALVLQEPVRNNNLSVTEFVALGRIPYSGWLGVLSDRDEQIINHSLSQVGIVPLARRKITQLSDGEWQKAMIARALTQETPIILLDEPTAHLDLLSKIEIVDMLRSTAVKDGKSVLFSTHDLDLTLQMADEVWLLDGDGQLYTGTPEDLVLQGVISHIYAREDLIGFEKETGSIRVPVSALKKPVRFTGEGMVGLWTRKALTRAGYLLTDQSDIEVKAFTDHGIHQWEIAFDQKIYRVECIAALLGLLESNLR